MKEFVDRSLVNREMKARRYLESISSAAEQKYFFEDGFPNPNIHKDAAAALEVFDAIRAERDSLLLDKERLDWVQNHFGNLLNDDGGRWAFSDCGSQPIPEEEGFLEPVIISSFVLPKEWKKSVRDAIDSARENSIAMDIDSGI